MLVRKINRAYNFVLTQELARAQLQGEAIMATYYKNDNSANSVVHSHPFFEIIMPIAGCNVTYYIGGSVYELKVGDVIFIPEETFHSVTRDQSSGASDRLVVQVESALWKSAVARTQLQDPEWNRQVTVVNRDYASLWDMRGLMERMVNTRLLRKEFQNLVLECQLVELQLLLEQTVTSRSAVAPNSSSQVVARAVTYLQTHYTDPSLNVATLAQKSFVSREYLSRIFKEYTMMSIHNYLNGLRIQHARNAIVNGSTILDACMESGFNTYSSFYKAFRGLYGMTPADYRKQVMLSLENAERVAEQEDGKDDAT